MEKDVKECEKILTPKEAARTLRLSRSTIYNLLKKKKLPAMKIGRQWRILKKDLFDIRR
jgi:putative molybdopterin biosynthesis protein